MNKLGMKISILFCLIISLIGILGILFAQEAEYLKIILSSSIATFTLLVFINLLKKYRYYTGRFSYMELATSKNWKFWYYTYRHKAYEEYQKKYKSK